MPDQDRPLTRVLLAVCDLCLVGDWDVCSTPGCSFRLNEGPDGSALSVIQSEAHSDVSAYDRLRCERDEWRDEASARRKDVLRLSRELAHLRAEVKAQRLADRGQSGGSDEQ